ncbi:MAG: methyltransferase protein [Conexibacter sp.]|nr:methyltransferase protein [Conexibacter sp.]
MPFDQQQFRDQSRDAWETAARGWSAQADWWDADTRPVSDWLVEALAPRPGSRVLELAAGPGDVGLLLAERLRPGGHALLTDGADAMVAAIEARAAARGLTDVVAARTMDAEAIDVETGSLDAVACRWGYMLLADPGAALRETRRVLRSGGRVALAAWDGPKANPWLSAAAFELRERGLVAPPDPAEPGPFSWRDRAAIGARLQDAGFTDVVLDTVHFSYSHPDLDTWWARAIDLGSSLANAIAAAGAETAAAIRAGAEARIASFVAADGSVTLPAATHVASAAAV